MNAFRIPNTENYTHIWSAKKYNYHVTVSSLNRLNQLKKGRRRKLSFSKYRERCFNSTEEPTLKVHTGAMRWDLLHCCFNLSKLVVMAQNTLQKQTRWRKTEKKRNNKTKVHRRLQVPIFLILLNHMPPLLPLGIEEGFISRSVGVITDQQASRTISVVLIDYRKK